MNDHNLDDLIIDHIEPSRKSSVKGFLTIIALAIVVMIVAIILTKIILKEPDNDQVLFEQNENEMISPDLTLQSVTEPQKETVPEPVKEPTPSAGEQTPQPSESKQSQPAAAEESVKENLFDDVSQTPPTETPKQDAKETTTAAAQSPIEEQQPATATAPATGTTSQESEKIQAPAPKSAPETKVKETVQPKPQPVPQRVIEEAVQKPDSRPANVLTRPGESTSKPSYGGNYYIQVGSFASTPSQSFLERIKSSGFSYTITQSGGSNKLLIGPYQDRSSAERALVQVRDRINKNAFIYTKK